MLLNQAHHPPSGCPACAGQKDIVQFNWQWSREPGNEDLARPSLVFRKKWKLGSLYQCSACGQPWYLDEAGERMTFLSPEKARLMEAWGSASHVLPGGLFEKARAIGATPPHERARRTPYAEVPCRVKTRGEWLDKCLIVFSASPPLEDYYANAGFVDEIADLEPSAYALPEPVRLEAGRSQPNEKGQALTEVESAGGKRFYLNWMVNFVDRKSLQGRDLRLADPFARREKGGNKPALLKEPLDSIHFFIGDWFEK